jgi:protein-S-isoprenylcysteine O-methyltransferase Ste14
MYVRLAKIEEREAIAEFGNVYSAYAVNVPAFIPQLKRLFGGSKIGSHVG